MNDEFEEAFLSPEMDADALQALLNEQPSGESPSGTARLMEALTFDGRLGRFAQTVASMIDVNLEAARTLLNGIDSTLPWGAEPGMDGIATLWVDGGPSVQGCVRGFVRLPAGAEFPEHDHLGTEEILVLQGHMLMSTGEVVGPGERHRGDPGKPHAFSAMAGGGDLLYFAVVKEGITIGEVAMRHRDGDHS